MVDYAIKAVQLSRIAFASPGLITIDSTLFVPLLYDFAISKVFLVLVLAAMPQTSLSYCALIT